MYPRKLSPPPRSFFLFGPRGTGKSTWVRLQFPDAVYLDLLDEGLYRRLVGRPETLSQLIPSKHTGWVILDEVQRVPAVLNEVHRLLESGRDLRFVLTGSSARKLRRGGVNLLGGRAVRRVMPTLTAEELGEDFELERALNQGLLPTAFLSDDPRDFLDAYVGTYLREEIQFEGLTRSIGAFSRFLEAISFSQASVLNISSVARDAEVERTVVSGYVEILEDLLLAHRLPAFTRRATRRLTKHPKFFLFDAGVFRAIRPRGPLDRPEEIDGAALETLVFQHLYAVNANEQLDYELSHWRTQSGAEVDFVLYGPKGLIAIEVKRTDKLRGRDFRGLTAFGKDYPMARCLMLYGGQQVESRPGGIEVIGIDAFLRDAGAILGPQPGF